MENIAVLFVALALDLLFGEPPRPLHPVVGMGKLTSALVETAPRGGPAKQLVYGGAMVSLMTILWALPAWALVAFARKGGALAYALVGGLALKPTFALRELGRAAGQVETYLASGKPDEARKALTSLVSRDVAPLTEAQMMSAVVESVAENFTDSFVAPLFYFWLFGVPGAVAYRVVNTMDAMIGYHGRYEYLGKAAARWDDVMSYLPARLSALLIVAGSFLAGRDVRVAWRIMGRDHGKTESPNAGWTMSAMAGALGVELEKPGHYRLGDPQEALNIEKVPQALKVTWAAAGLGLLLFLLAEVTRVYLSQTPGSKA